MSFPTQTYRVLIASPSDLTEERKAAAQAVNDCNVMHAAAEGIVLLPVMWETHATPESGVRPQEAINQQLVKDSDILVGIECLKDPIRAYFQLSHEVIHLLDPVAVQTHASNNLEEGVATHFTIHYMKKNFKVDCSTWSDKSYDDARLVFEDVLKICPDFGRKIRDKAVVGNRWPETFSAEQLVDIHKQGYSVEDRPRSSVTRAVKDFFVEELKRRPELSRLDPENINIVCVRAAQLHWIDNGKEIDIDSGDEYVEKDVEKVRPLPLRKAYLRLQGEVAQQTYLAELKLEGVPSAEPRQSHGKKAAGGGGSGPVTASGYKEIATKPFEDVQMYVTIDLVTQEAVINSLNLDNIEAMKDLPSEHPVLRKLVEAYYRFICDKAHLAFQIEHEDDFDGRIAQKKQEKMRLEPGLADIKTSDRYALVSYQLIRDALREGGELHRILERIREERRKLGAELEAASEPLVAMALNEMEDDDMFATV